MNQPDSKSPNTDGEGCCGCLFLCLLFGCGWLVVGFIQSKNREQLSGEPYFIGGNHSNIEEQRWLEEAEQQWLIAQSRAPYFGSQLGFSYPIPSRMAAIASEQGYGNIMNRPQREQEAIYRQAAASLVEAARVPEASVREKLYQFEKTLDTGFELKCIVAEMAVTERDIVSQKYYEVLGSIRSWLPVEWKAQIKKNVGWDVDKSDPKLRRALETYQRFVYAAHELDPTASSDQVKGLFGLLENQTFAQTLDNFLRLQGTYLFGDVDSAIIDGYRIQRSTVYKSNLLGYGIQAPGSNAANAIPVHSQREEDSFPVGAWLIDSIGKSYQKRDPQTHYF
jgi:hypothetical protein